MSFPESSQTIRNRMLQEIARQWGYPEEATDVAAGFDPLVNLLAGACAKEFEKLSDEIHASRGRIANRMVDLLTPDVLTSAFPAHGVAQARPHRTTYFTRAADGFFAEHRGKAVPFSPLPAVKLLNGSLRCRATGDRLVHAAKGTETLVGAKAGKSLPAHTLWLGLELDGPPEALAGLPFYFRWPSDLPHQGRLYQWLKLTRWYAGGAEIAVVPELLPGSDEKRPSPGPLKFTAAYHASLQIEHAVHQLYRDQFVTLNPAAGHRWEPATAACPVGFESVFPLEALEALPGKLVWLEVRFPAFFPPEALKRVFCAINCFPVMNRRLHQKGMSLREHTNMVALDSDELFLDVQAVTDSDEVEYHEVPLDNLRNYEGGTYFLRKEGVAKLDGHAASEALRRLTGALREESSAFAAFNKKEYLSKKILQLNQEISDLEQTVERQASRQKTPPYLVVKPRHSGTALHITYWSTEGAAGNQVPAGTPLGMDNGAVMHKNSMRLLTTTRGGKDEPDAAGKIHAYKQALLSRGRIVSAEDIRAYCWAQLGNQVAEVEVAREVDYGGLPGQGLGRVIQVRLTPSDEGSAADPGEWQERCRGLEIQLNGLSTGVLPIRVACKGEV